MVDNGIHRPSSSLGQNPLGVQLPGHRLTHVSETMNPAFMNNDEYAKAVPKFIFYS